MWQVLGVVELLWNSKYEEQHRRDQRMALSQNMYVYMEIMEEVENEGSKLGVPEDLA